MATLDDWCDKWMLYVVDCGIVNVHAISVDKTMQVAANLLDHFYNVQVMTCVFCFCSIENIVRYKHNSCYEAALQALMEGSHVTVK